MNVIEKQKSLITPTLFVTLVSMVLANTAGNMFYPLLPLYLKSLNAGVVQVGLFFTFSQIAPLALQILGGWLSDSLGRLRSIALGSLAGVLSYVGLILAPTWQWVLVGETFGAMTRSLVAPSFDALIAEQSAEKDRARVFGMVESVFIVVNIIGPPLGGWIVDRYGFKTMLVCAGVLYSLATVMRVLLARRAAYKSSVPTKPLSLASLKGSMSAMLVLLTAGGLVTWILLTDGVRDVAFALSFNLLPLYLEDIGGLSVQQIGWLESVFGLAMMLVAVPAGWLADKKGERLGIAVGFFLHFVAVMMFIQVSGFWGFAAAWAVLGVGAGLMSPAFQALISKAVPEKLRGIAYGMFRTSLGVVSLPAPAIGAQLWQRFGPQFPFMITAWMALLAIVPIWLKFKLPDKTAAAAPILAAQGD